MLCQQITLQLKQINLNLDEGTIASVSTYLMQKIGFLNDIQPQLQLYAGVAIVSQIETRPTIGQQAQSTNKIKIENVMSHLGKLSKEKFLDTANRQLEKYKQAPQYLKKKLEDVRYSYRFYKKYQTAFEKAWKVLGVNSGSKDELSAMFWVVYLYVKNSWIETENITESRNFVILLIRMIFQKFLSASEPEHLLPILTQHIGTIPPIPSDKYQTYTALVESKLSSFYIQRFTQPNINFFKLMNNYTMVDRLVDDMSNAYVKDMVGLKFYNDIDELSYLELKKNITPQVFRKPAVLEEPQEVIQTQLDFWSDDQPDAQISLQNQDEIQQTPTKMPIIEGSDGLPTPKPTALASTVSPNSTRKFPAPTSPTIYTSFMSPDISICTPISKKCQNESWMHKIIEPINQQQIQSFQKFFTQLSNLNQNPNQIVQESQPLSPTLKQNIYKLIESFTPKCNNYEERFSKIMALIISNFSSIQSSNKQMFGEMTSLKHQQQQILGIASVSCEIFNYIHNSVSYAFKNHCEVFSTNAKTAFDTLNLFAKDISFSMPHDLKEYLQKTMKRFFIDDIWQNGQGYKILCESTSKPDCELTLIHQKIISSAQSRIKQICRQASIQTKIITKTQNMIKFIFQKKPYLLKNNNVDQIILCCIMSCLSFNEKEQHQTLEILFFEYNSKIQFSYNSNQLNLKDQFGNQMKIVDYYNEVFLAEIQDILTENQDQLDHFLLTPVRITKRFSGSSLENTLKDKRQPILPGIFVFNPERAKNAKNSYRQNLLKQRMQMMEEKEQNQEDEKQKDLPSPNFGMTRTITFADLSKK